MKSNYSRRQSDIIVGIEWTNEQVMQLLSEIQMATNHKTWFNSLENKIAKCLTEMIIQVIPSAICNP